VAAIAYVTIGAPGHDAAAQVHFIEKLATEETQTSPRRTADAPDMTATARRK
jgi:hypothetical protein